MKKRLLLTAVLPLTLATLWGCSTEQTPRAVRVEGPYRYAAQASGYDTPAAQCVVCHSMDKSDALRVAPTLWGIVGADKARFSWYGYSKALADAEGTWTEEDLDKYLKDPDEFLPGTTKTLIGLADDVQRGELIDFLKTLKD